MRIILYLYWPRKYFIIYYVPNFQHEVTLSVVPAAARRGQGIFRNCKRQRNTLFRLRLF